MALSRLLLVGQLLSQTGGRMRKSRRKENAFSDFLYLFTFLKRIVVFFLATLRTLHFRVLAFID